MNSYLKRHSLRLFAAVVCGGVLTAAHAGAEPNYPTRPIKMIVPFAPGGGVDLIARIVAQKLGQRLGQAIVVDNRAGASSTIGTDIVAKAPADGYTVLMTSTAVTANQSLFHKLPYDLAKDFVPIGMVANAPAILVVNPSVPAASLQQLIALARSKPDTLTYASYGNGSAPHLATELFKQATKTKLLHIPYKGGGPAVMATLSGETSLIIPSVVPVLQQVKDGKLRALGIASGKRHILLPNVPTFREQGVDLETGTWFGMLAPAGLPPAIAAKLSAELAAVVKDTQVQERLLAEGAEIRIMDAKQFSIFLRAEEKRWRDVVSKGGIQAE